MCSSDGSERSRSDAHVMTLVSNIDIVLGAARKLAIRGSMHGGGTNLVAQPFEMIG